MTKKSSENNLIKEIMVSVSFEGDISLQTLEERIEKSPLIMDTFKKTQDAYSTSLKFDPVKTKSKTAKVGVILESGNKNKVILQVKTGIISYHMLDHYVSSDQFAKLFQEYWSEIVSLENIVPKELTIRYINFIPVEQGENLSDVINLKIEHPYEMAESEFYTSKFQKNGKPVSIVFAYDGLKERRGVYFDHSIKQMFNEKEKISNLADIINELRPIKNDIFFSILTEKTKNKYFNGTS
ncbi:MAG: TIGR04255 family protein [Saprospirales bacterium]|nr:MAG: TIGR04255 family protein [Saprospirales bacterium]